MPESRPSSKSGCRKAAGKPAEPQESRLGGKLTSRQAGHAGPGPGSVSFQGLSQQGKAGAWPPVRPSHRWRRRARQRRPASQGVGT